MQINTTRFGTITVKDDSILSIPQGMLGFEPYTKYVLIQDKPDMACQWLQSVDNAELAFMVIDPADYFPDYEVEISDQQAKSLGVEDPSEVVIFTTITFNSNTNKITANLLGPVVINTKTMQAQQIVMQDDRYCTKHIIGEIATRCSETELLTAA